METRRNEAYLEKQRIKEENREVRKHYCSLKRTKEKEAKAKEGKQRQNKGSKDGGEGKRTKGRTGQRLAVQQLARER